MWPTLSLNQVISATVRLLYDSMASSPLSETTATVSPILTTMCAHPEGT